jgi:hypothetical protein
MKKILKYMWYKFPETCLGKSLALVYAFSLVIVVIDWLCGGSMWCG